MCGFLGLVNAPQAVHEIYDGLIAVQHRGQDAAGIVTYSDRFHARKGGGLVRDIFGPEDFERLEGTIGVGHVRYPTIGSGGVEDAQPFVVNYPYGIAMAHNGNLSNYAELKEQLTERDGRHIDSSCDVEVILNVFAAALIEHGNQFQLSRLWQAVDAVLERVRGAYSVVGMIAGHGLYAFRDPFGIKPIAFGCRQNGARTSYAVSSESVVLDLLGYEQLQPPAPGEALFVGVDGQVARRELRPPALTPCIFEWVYFARPDSQLEGLNVYHARLRMGERLAAKVRERRLEVDVVVPVPDSARAAGKAMAEALGVDYHEGLVKNRYIGRTFIMPDQGSRQRSVRHKLNAIPSVFAGKRVLLVDDSIVRGNTSRNIVQMARRSGAAQVFLASTAPPLRHPCVYGIDMATRREFIAGNRSEAEIAELLDVDALIYQDLGDLERAVAPGGEVEQFCNACFSGNYPTGDVSSETLLAIERERLCPS